LTRPATLAIDDLAHPRFTPEIEEIRAALRPLGDAADLSPMALLVEASAQTGLDDFGADDGWSERLSVLCVALGTEANLGGIGRFNVQQQLLQPLRNRLLLTDLLRRHPQIHDERIVAPIVIVGQPRTGTTHLHQLLAADPDLRFLPYWESLEPVLSMAEQSEVEAGAPDPRVGRADVAVGFINASMPEFKRMHEMTTWHAHEEIQLLAIDLSTMLFETIAPMPAWRDHYRARDQTASYEYLRTILKALQWQHGGSRGGSRWVLKSPQHLEQLGALMRVFPDATVAITHRDPVAVTASLAMMLAYSARMTFDEVDPWRIGRYWADRNATMLHDCMRDRELVPAEQSIDVRFDEFMADDLAMVERIYALADQPLPAVSRAAMHDYLHAHPRGRFGAVDYSLAQFGLDEAALRQTFAPYVERFGVRADRV
jgi:Sulfotransferase family